MKKSVDTKQQKKRSETSNKSTNTQSRENGECAKYQEERMAAKKKSVEEEHTE